MKVVKVTGNIYQVYFNDKKAVVVKAHNEKDAIRKAKTRIF